MEYSNEHNDFILTTEDLGLSDISINTLESAVRRKKIQRADRGQYLWKSLGDCWQNQIKANLLNGLDPFEFKLKQAEEAAKESTNELENIIKVAYETGYPKYLNYYLKLGTERAREYARAVAIIESVIGFMQNNRISARKYTWFCDTLSPIINKLELKTLPNNPLILQRNYFQKILNQQMSITEVVKPPRIGNKNASKFSIDDDLMSVIKYLGAHPACFSNAHIARVIRNNWALLGKSIPSDSLITHELAKAEMKFIVANGRFNPQSRQNNAYNLSIPLANALFAGDCWQADGTRINMIAHKDNGKEEFLYIIAVRDVHSGDILGLHFDHVENRWGWLSAIRMAVENAKYLPHQFVIDKFPGHNTDEVKYVFDKLEQYGCKVDYTSKSTGKAQQERWFGTLQSVFMQCSRYYYGEGITSTRSFAHRSEAYLNQAKKEAKNIGFDFEKAVIESIQVVEMYRNTPLSAYSRKHQSIDKSPAQLHIDSDKPNVLKPASYQLADIFWSHRLETLTKQQIRMEVNKEEAIYIVDNYPILKAYTGARLLVRYNEFDLNKIYVFDNNNGGFITELERFDRIQIYGSEPEYGRLSKLKASARLIEEQRRNELLYAKEKAEKVLKAPLFMEALDESTLLMPRMTAKSLKEATETRMLTGNNDLEAELDIDVRDQY